MERNKVKENGKAFLKRERSNSYSMKNRRKTKRVTFRSERERERERLSFFRFAVDAEAARFNEHRNVPLLLPSLVPGFFHPSLFFPFARFRFFHRFAEFPGILHRGFVSRVFLLPKERSFSFLSSSYHLPFSFPYPSLRDPSIARLID